MNVAVRVPEWLEVAGDDRQSDYWRLELESPSMEEVEKLAMWFIEQAVELRQMIGKVSGA